MEMSEKGDLLHFVVNCSNLKFLHKTKAKVGISLSLYQWMYSEVHGLQNKIGTLEVQLAKEVKVKKVLEEKCGKIPKNMKL